MKLHSLDDLLVDQLRDLYTAENQIIKALPKMARAATSEELKAAFEEHLRQTKQHAERLERIFEQLDVSPKGKKCKGMAGLIDEGKETLDNAVESSVRDAALIAAAQRVEHYEMAAYGCARTYASMLAKEEAVGLLEQTLAEEKRNRRKTHPPRRRGYQHASGGGRRARTVACNGCLRTLTKRRFQHLPGRRAYPDGTSPPARSGTFRPLGNSTAAAIPDTTSFAVHTS